MKVNDKYLEERIVARVRDLIAERGVTGWNMDRLAEETGVAKNTLYKIVRSKEEIVARVVLDHMGRVMGGMAELLEKTDDYQQTTAALISRFPRLIDFAFIRRLGEIFREFPSIETEVRGHRDRLTSGVLGFLREGIRRGILRDDISPEFILDLLQAVVLYHFTSGLTGQPLAERLEKSFHCIFHGIGK